MSWFIDRLDSNETAEEKIKKFIDNKREQIRLEKNGVVATHLSGQIDGLELALEILKRDLKK